MRHDLAASLPSKAATMGPPDNSLPTSCELMGPRDGSYSFTRVQVGYGNSGRPTSHGQYLLDIDVPLNISTLNLSTSFSRG
jgi:hypothetical protein